MQLLFLRLLTFMARALCCGLLLALPAWGQSAERGPDGPVVRLTVLADGQVLVGGRFTHYDGVERPGLARLLADGSLDPGFVPAPFPPGATILTMLGQADGRILVGGITHAPRCATCVKEDGWGFLERRLPNGAVDSSFTWPFARRAGRVFDTMMQDDGRILVSGGPFPGQLPLASSALVRLLPDGRCDSMFKVSQAAYSDAYRLTRQPDGQVLVVHNWVPGYSAGVPLHRLTTAGATDTTFTTGLGNQYNNPGEVAIQADGRILVGGQEDIRKGLATSTGLIRLLPNGRPDPTFAAPRFGNRTYVYALLVQPDGRIVCSSAFWLSNPEVEKSYRQYCALPFWKRRRASLRFSVATLENARQGERRWRARHGWLQQLLPDGRADPGFHASRRPNGAVTVLARLPDGQLLVGGEFTVYDGHPARYLTRLRADGTRADVR